MRRRYSRPYSHRKNSEIYKGKKPVACPSQEAIGKAIETLGDQLLHVYQLLLYNDLTDCNTKRPIIVKRRSWKEGSFTTRLELFHHDKPEVKVSVTGEESDEKLLDIARKLIENLNKEKIHSLACCGFAELSNCVCAHSFKCPLHGETHIGSHD